MKKKADGSMEKKDVNKFTWVIKDFSSLQSEKIHSNQFVIDGCKWCILAYPKGNNKPDDFSLFLKVANSESLPSGWRRHTQISLTIVNQITNYLSILRETQHWFDEKSPNLGFPTMFPLSELDPRQFLVNGELKIVAEIDVLEVIGKLDVVKESIEVNGFQVLPSQWKFLKCLFGKQPDIASKLHIKNQHLRKGYMNVLLSLIETLHQPPHQISKDDLDDAYDAKKTLADAGFRFDWLEEKLHEMSAKKKKEEACETQMQELEMELKELKQKCSDIEGLLEIKREELLGTRAPLWNDDTF